MTAGMIAGALCASAQTDNGSDCALRATAEFGVANSLAATSSLPGATQKISSMNFSLEFDRTFFRKGPQTLSFNIGLGYMTNALTSDLGEIEYSYNAGAAADMDGNPYIRYYELGSIHQKQQTGYLAIPLYLSYGYRINRFIKLHADAGFRFGFKVTSALNEVSGTSYAYGIYPQYDNLLINAPYLNEFGETDLADARKLSPEASAFNCNALIGIGAEFNIYGPIAIDVALRYNIGLTNLYKKGISGIDFKEDTAPVSYTVDGGQSVRPLSNFLTKSKFSNLAVMVGLVYHF